MLEKFRLAKEAEVRELLRLRNILRQAKALGNDAHILAGPLLVADIDLRGRIAADQDHCQPGRPPMPGRQHRDLILEFLTDDGGRLFSVDDMHGVLG